MRYGLRYWLTDLSADSTTDSLVRINIFTTLQRAGIRVSEPQQTVHLVEHDEEHAEMVQEREIQRRIKALKGVDLFARLTARELRTLAKRLNYCPFAKGDVITRQGSVSDCIYILASGEAEVLFETETGEKRSLATLKSGRFFGEMGLMTGEPRRATVVARTEMVCYQLDKGSFQDLIVKRPAIAENISQIIASRQFGLDTARQNLAEDAPTRTRVTANCWRNSALFQLRCATLIEHAHQLHGGPLPPAARNASISDPGGVTILLQACSSYFGNGKKCPLQFPRPQRRISP